MKEAGREADIVLAADGGIRHETVPRLRAAGAETVVLGSLAFGDPDLAQPHRLAARAEGRRLMSEARARLRSRRHGAARRAGRARRRDRSPSRAAPTHGAGAGSDAVIGQIDGAGRRRPADGTRRQMSPASASARRDRSIRKAGIVIAPPTLAGWHDVPLIDILEQAFRPAGAAGERRQCRRARRMALRRRPWRRLAGLRHRVDRHRRRRRRRRPHLSRPARARRRDRPHDHHRRRRALLLRRRRLLRGGRLGNRARPPRHGADSARRRLGAAAPFGERRRDRPACRRGRARRRRPARSTLLEAEATLARHRLHQSACISIRRT